MIVRCPSCGAAYDCPPGKYECVCGAKFCVEPDGRVSLAGPAPKSGQIADFPEDPSGGKLRGIPKWVVAAVALLAVAALLPVAGIVVYGYRSHVEEQRDLKLRERRQKIEELTSAARSALRRRAWNELDEYIDALQPLDPPSAKELRRAADFGSAIEREERRGFEFSPDGKILLKAPRDLRDCEIPSWVTAIGDDAFRECEFLISVTIPSGVTAIGKSAFAGCEALESVTIPDGVVSIGDSAFSGCRSLKPVTLPAGVTSIGWSAFAKCKTLNSVTVPTGVTSIGAGAFAECPCEKQVRRDFPQLYR